MGIRSDGTRGGHLGVVVRLRHYPLGVPFLPPRPRRMCSRFQSANPRIKSDRVAQDMDLTATMET